MKKTILGMILALALLATVAAPALAKESTTLAGTVQSVDTVAGSFSILTTEGTTLTVIPPESYDLTTLTVGALVELKGDMAEDGSFLASLIVILPVSVEAPKNTGFYCSNSEVTLPSLAKVVELYSSDYATALSLFCQGGYGVGGVALMLAASQASGLSLEALAAMRGNMGWGLVWKALRAANEETAATETDPVNNSNKPDWAGNNNEEHGNRGNGNSGGKGHGKGPGH